MEIKKNVYMIITEKKYQQSLPIVLGRFLLKCVKEYKYLGAFLKPNLISSAHITNVSNKALRKL